MNFKVKYYDKRSILTLDIYNIFEIIFRVSGDEACNIFFAEMSDSERIACSRVTDPLGITIIDNAIIVYEEFVDKEKNISYRRVNHMEKLIIEKGQK